MRTSPAPNPAVGRNRPRGTAVAVCALCALVILGVLAVGSTSGILLLLAASAVLFAVCAVISPVFVAAVFLVTLFFRLPIKDMVGALPIEVFWLMFAGLAGAAVLWMARTPDRLRGIGGVEWAMAGYLAWNYYSMLAPHQYAEGSPLTAGALPIPRFIFVGTVIPFALYMIGRYTFDRERKVRILLWMILAFATYSAAVSIMPSVGLGGWVWPQYIVTEVRPSWSGRAVGIFNQPVANGMVLSLGFAVAMVLSNRRQDPAWQRIAALAVAIAAGCGLFFTHTRAVWLSGVVVLLIGAVLAKGHRKGFVAILVALGATVALNWSSFTSADRGSGGVGSDVEVQSRLNDMMTALWAFTQRPIDGWGIGRFQSINSYHHKQWSPDTPWSAGWGEASHENELAILAELGLIGLTAWVCVLVFIGNRLWRAYRTVPDDELCGKPLVLMAMMAGAIFLCAGLTVDLRYFDFATAIIFLLVGVAVGWADRYAAATTAAVLDTRFDGLPRLEAAR